MFRRTMDAARALDIAPPPGARASSQPHRHTSAILASGGATGGRPGAQVL
ncbi:MAG: hypothetical protein R2911_38110 [Caldilineaceae bacterium]